jgi:hypothetical protein
MFNWLNHWMRSWFGICLLKRTPQDDQFSYSGLMLGMTLYVASDFLVAAASSGWKVGWGMTAIDVLILIALTFFLLKFTNKSERFLQTLTALAGTGGLLGLIVLPAVQSTAFNTPTQQNSGMLVLFWLVMMVWSVVVRAHIYRHALSQNYATGAAVAIVQAMIVLRLVNHWFPQAG